MQLTYIKDNVAADLNAVSKLISNSLHSEVPLIGQVADYLIQSGGKRLRPLLVLLAAQACGYDGKHQTTMAAVIEFIHTATLLHDDVVDNSRLRRGRATANFQWSDQTAILVGDFLYSRAFQLMLQVSDLQILNIIANSTNTIAEGEVLQLLKQKDPATNEAEYLRIIRNKTAKLFEAAAEIGAVLSKQPRTVQIAFAQFGLHLGTAYQLIDDVLDYQADMATFGKNIGNDLAEGKPTMPIIYVLQHGTDQQKTLMQNALMAPQEADFAAIFEVLIACGALEYTKRFAEREAQLAKQALLELPSAIVCDDLNDLVDFVIDRDK